ncbi:unnamed protein product [Brugia timori]|uniref:Uncharacterized protein n=1 Tax=Brugia timori TaxID=42155 RepID=A0A3P7XZY9_9BILA|nr:unnamed protein product [Brugia timori]
MTAGYVPRNADYYKEYNAAAGSDVGVRCTLMSPSTCPDGNTLCKCLEELKRKRQEATVAVSETNSRSGHQQHSQRNHYKERNETDFGNINVVLRTRSSESFRTEQRRLSVPDLADLAHTSLTNGVTGVLATAKALTSKLGRNPRTGELQTINEGLVTPVIRRKQYIKDIHGNNSTNDWRTGSLLQKPSLTHKELAKQAEQEDIRHDGRDGAEPIFTRNPVICANYYYHYCCCLGHEVLKDKYFVDLCMYVWCASVCVVCYLLIAAGVGDISATLNRH